MVNPRHGDDPAFEITPLGVYVCQFFHDHKRLREILAELNNERKLVLIGKREINTEGRNGEVSCIKN